MSDSGSRTGHAIKRAEQALIAAKESVLRPLGLTVPQYAALLALSEEPGIGGAELARRCLVTPQSMSTVLSNLQSKELIGRPPHRLHRRVVETCITDAGQASSAAPTLPPWPSSRRSTPRSTARRHSSETFSPSQPTH